MTKQELDKLMLRLQRGDESAFEEIYNDTKRGLFAFICRFAATIRPPRI